MAYFPNGISGEVYEASICRHCVHHDNCAVMLAHMVHNYDQIKNGKIVEDHVLQILIPDGKDRQPTICRMFYSDDPQKNADAKASWVS